MARFFDMRPFVTLVAALLAVVPAGAQIDTERVMRIGCNALWYDDYVLSISYFNQAIASKPYLAQPYFYRAIAKLNLDDYAGAEADATMAIERNPFLTDAWEVRGVARQNSGKEALAIADYNRALESLPESRALLYNKAMAQTTLCDYAAADSTFTRLLRHHPSFDGGWTGRARLRLLTADTVGAVADICRALEANPNNANAYVMRADISMNRGASVDSALADMDRAIRLQPRVAPFFINRAWLRYKADDYYGALADYDYALRLEPLNTVALFNRSLLRAEVRDNDRALEDLCQVLRLEPSNHRALFNRAILYRETGRLEASLADLDRLIASFPDFSAAWFLRYEVKNAMGRRDARDDYRRSMELARTDLDLKAEDFAKATEAAEGQGLTQEQVRERFTTLQTLRDATAPPEEVYNNPNIKGRIQDNTPQMELQPMFVLTYYLTSTELRPAGLWTREVSDVNDTRLLRFLLQLAPASSYLPEEAFDVHNASIEAATRYVSTRTPRPLDWFGRAMDYATLRDWGAAEEDFTRAIEAKPDFALAWLGRATARARRAMETDEPVLRRGLALAALADLDSVARLSPSLAVAHYDKGVVLALLLEDHTSALSAFTRAIQLDPTLGEAWYNRGYVLLSLGDLPAATSDLSRAGELGIATSYSLLKRLSGGR